MFALPLFCNRDLDINPMTFKPEGDLNILKMYFHTENEASSLRHTKLRAWIGKKYENMSQIKGRDQNVKISELLLVLS